MKLSRLFKSLKKGDSKGDGKQAGTTSETANSSSETGEVLIDEKSRQKPPPAEPPVQEADTSGTSEDKRDMQEAGTDMAHIASMLESIQSVLGDEKGVEAAGEPDGNELAPMPGQKEEAFSKNGETVSLPASAILQNLCEELRGPNYDPANFPDIKIPLKLEKVLQQLKAGCVEVSLSNIIPLLPAGWVIDDKDREVQVDLPAVVAAVPSEMLGGSQRKSQSFDDLAGTEDLFQAKRKIAAPAADGEIAAAEPKPQSESDETVEIEDRGGASRPEPAASSTKTSPPAKTRQNTRPSSKADATRIIDPIGWTGVEKSLAAGAGIDLNTASIEELANIPGVGESRALQIIDIRRQDGKLKHVYELMRIPGVGPGLFRQMTGLSPTTGRNRLETLNRLLGFAEDADISLQEITRSFAATVGAEGCILCTDDGIPLSFTAELEDATDRYAAITTQLFHRTARYLHGITGSTVECISLPVASPPLILFTVNNIYLVLVQGKRLVTLRDFKKATAIATEIGWLLGPRAVIREI